MLKYIAAILLIANMGLGLFVWLEDHDDQKLRILRLSVVLALSIMLLFIIYLADTWFSG